MRITRLTRDDVGTARRLFAVMSEVFEEDGQPLSDRYLRDLLSRAEFWAFAALDEGQILGGLTAHTLAMTTSEASAVFLYDIAVRPEHQRQGVGRALVTALREAAGAAGITELFVPADNEDAHALDFYRALGGSAAAVTIFTFGAPEQPQAG